VGSLSGDNITDGIENTIIGYGARPSSASAQNQIVIGRASTGLADNTVTLGNSSVTDVYMAQDSGATVHAKQLILKSTSNHILLHDTDEGDPNDSFRLEHDGGHFRIDFYDDSAGLTTSNLFTVSNTGNATFSGDVKLGDNVKALFGNSNDLQIYHNGTHSYINETGTGNLIIYQGSNTAVFSPTSVNINRDATFSGDVTIKSTGANDDPATFALWSTDVSISANDTIGTILAQGSDSGNSPPYLGGKIEFNADANWDTGTNGYYPTRIDFFTESNSGTVSTASPRMTIDSSGNTTFAGDVTIGSNNLIFDTGEKVFSTGGYVVADGDAGFIARDSGVNKLIINGSTATFSTTILIDGLSNYTGLEVKGAGGARPQVKWSNVNNGVIGQIYGTEANALVITTGTSSNTALTIDSSQNVTFADKLNLHKANGTGLTSYIGIRDSGTSSVRSGLGLGTADSTLVLYVDKNNAIGSGFCIGFTNWWYRCTNYQW
jgi:hypothetical protein